MMMWRSAYYFVGVIFLGGVLGSCQAAEPALIQLEPVFFEGSLNGTSVLRVVGSTDQQCQTTGECGGKFPLDLRTAGTVKFDLQAPTDKEYVLEASLQDNSIILLFEADAECSDSPYRGNQMFASSLITVSVKGTNVTDLAQGYDSFQSTVSIQDGCTVYTRLLFVGSPDGPPLQASLSKISWSVSFNTDMTAEGPLTYSYSTTSSGLTSGTFVKTVTSQPNEVFTATSSATKLNTMYRWMMAASLVLVPYSIM
mmetsp:Transcript_10860/g.19856  ORF Transcript_10860/g.19856 Transcript_10860/m.19856 type:complete len:254 (-) Transcript_10860:173-934(-)